MDKVEISNRRNQDGFKHYSDCYRTIKGEHFECLFDGRTDKFLNEQKAILIKNGHKVRKIKDSLYVYQEKGGV